jgi:hypothetical protein
MEWPPLEYITRTVFWTDTYYESYWRKLAKPAMVPTVDSHGGFYTVTNASASEEPQDASTQTQADVVGVIHYLPLKKGSPVPTPLKQLPVAMGVVELGGDDPEDAVHTYLALLLQQGKPVVIYGSKTGTTIVVNELKTLSGLDDLVTTDVELCRPVPRVNVKFGFDLNQMTFLTKGNLPFIVCPPPPIR